MRVEEAGALNISGLPLCGWTGAMLISVENSAKSQSKYKAVTPESYSG